MLKTLLTSSSCPPAVLALSAPVVLRAFPDPFPQQSKAYIGDFDMQPIRAAALRALGFTDGQCSSPSDCYHRLHERYARRGLKHSWNGALKLD